MSGLRNFWQLGKPFENDENAFYFILKALFVLKILNFCLDFLVIHKKALIRKVNFTIYDVANWLKNNCITYISRSKNNQKMKFDQLIEYNIGNIFLEKLYTKYVGEFISDHFLKNQIWAYLWINSSKFYTAYFYCMPNWRPSWVIELKLQTTCFYLKEH